MRGYALVRSLTDANGSDAEETVRRLAAEMTDAGESGSLRLSLGGHEEGAERRAWMLSLDGGDAEVGANGSSADVELLTALETFQRMADGSYSPVQAFLDGKLRVRGDVSLGKRILRHLAGPGGLVDCR